MSSEQEQKELDDPLGTKRDVDNYEFGLSQGINNQDLIGSQQEALMMLRESLQTAPEVSPTQALAAGALAIAPAIGGYFAGKSVGNAYVSPWLKPETILGMDLPGANRGARMAMEAGQKEGDEYLNDLKRYQEMERQQKFKVGALELQQANLQERSQASIAAANAREAQRFQNQKAMVDYKISRGVGGGNDGPKFPRLDSNPIARQAWDNVASGNGTKEDFALLTPDEQLAATQAGSRMSYDRQVESLDNQRRRQIATTQLGGDIVPTRPNAFDPKLDQRRADILKGKNMATTAISGMIDSVAKNGVKILGPETFVQRGLASLSFTGARTLAQTGMRLEGREAELVQALSAPNIDINGAASFLSDWVRSQGDYLGALQAIKNIIDLSYDSALEGYGQTSRSYAERMGLPILDINQVPGMQGLNPISSPAPSGTLGVTPTPPLQGESLTDRLRRLRAERGAKNAVQ